MFWYSGHHKETADLEQKSMCLRSENHGSWQDPGSQANLDPPACKKAFTQSANLVESKRKWAALSYV